MGTFASALMVTLALLFAPAAQAAPKRSLDVVLTTKSQQKVLDSNAIPVSAYSKSAARVRITAVARTTGSKGRGQRVADTQVVALRKGKKQRVRLPITTKGRKTLSNCGGRRLVIQIKRFGSKKAAQATDVLTIDRGACRKSATADVQTENANRCDFLDTSHCLHPWPSDHFTKSDHSTPTKVRLNLKRDSMPANLAGVRIDPADQNRADGFSPGNLVVTHVPGLDNQDAWRRTKAVPITDMARYADPDQAVVVINAKTGKRHLIWTELDVNAKKPEDANLVIRPGVNWDEGGRYIVALRNLKTGDGKPIEAQDEFRAYRDRLTTSNKDFEERRPHMESVLATLEKAGVERDSLYLAWDFTVASRESLSARMLHIRDDAFKQLGDSNLADGKVEGSAPPFTVTRIENFVPCGTDGCQDGEDDNMGRRVTGTIAVPCYLNAPGCPPGGRFTIGSDGLPQRLPLNTQLAEFVCTIPRKQTDGAAGPARASLYGHGLLGQATEVSAGNVKAMANEHNFVFCATPWAGMSREDVPNVATILLDLSNFASLADRAQQGMVNFMYLGRAMIHPQGLGTHPAFQTGTVPHSVLDTSALYYDGNSQGGIMGGSLAAVAPDFTRAVLGVPAMNYSTLLRRSVDFDQYAVIMYNTYPDEGERPLILSIIQLLWDRGEANGYAHHMTDDPLPGTPAHKVLMHPAFGDHQVANAAADVEARTIGAKATPTPLSPGRSYEKEPLFGIERLAAFPYDGSAIVYFDNGPIRAGVDSGVATPPSTELPPRPPDYGADPHSAPRSAVHGRVQKSEFLKPGGRVVDVCGGKPCYSAGWAGP
jgi:hypothetical protein